MRSVAREKLGNLVPRRDVEQVSGAGVHAVIVIEWGPYNGDARADIYGLPEVVKFPWDRIARQQFGQLSVVGGVEQVCGTLLGSSPRYCDAVGGGDRLAELWSSAAGD